MQMMHPQMGLYGEHLSPAPQQFSYFPYGALRRPVRPPTRIVNLPPPPPPSGPPQPALPLPPVRNHHVAGGHTAAAAFFLRASQKLNMSRRRRDEEPDGFPTDFSHAMADAPPLPPSILRNLGRKDTPLGKVSLFPICSGVGDVYGRFVL
ncbi:unnamed protein product [Darwinula stevensoni]|uniref:Uncharacterized protein n=1 Tax=Darwinula stevensoni TaxID=69355 RepID=A0A7R9FP43_9CRUS|nr:unnamed protein product [Darwinula stevensoni]CAG0897480.1 unnamed protein product [Darwinula stevensoni]